MKRVAALSFGVLLFLTPTFLAGQVPSERPAITAIPTELVHGRMAVVRIPGREISGELLAVSPDFLWLGTGMAMDPFSLQDVQQVEVRMHEWGGKRVLLWVLGAGLGSAAGLAGACSGVSSNCGDVFAGVALSWAVVGGLTGVALHRSSRRALPNSYDALRPYVRYPQGLPAGPPLPDSARGAGYR